MKPRSPRSRLAIGSVLVALVILALPAAAPVAAAEPLPLHVENAIGAPGGRVAVVLRAYASRPIGQGQVCFVAQPPPETQEPPPSSPPQLLSYTDSVVFSQAGDALIEFEQVESDPPTFILRFVSPSATVNEYDGPLAVVYFDLHPDAVPGSEYSVHLDVENTHVFDEEGVAIEILPLDGTLRVRSAGDPFELAAEAGRVTPGATTQLVVRSFEPVGWGAGRVGLRYDPTVLEGPPLVHTDPRHGAAVFDVDTSTPGLVVVDFSSIDGSFNTVPGRLLRFDLAVSPSARPVSVSPVWLDPSWTSVVAPDGQYVPLALEDDALEIAPPVRGGPGFPDRPFQTRRRAGVSTPDY